MTDLWVSVSVLGAAVLLCEAARRAVAAFSPAAYRIYLLEAVCTFQLCCCTHELKLIGDAARLEPPLSLALTYAMTVVHLQTFRGASCNPCSVLEGIFRGGGHSTASTSSSSSAALVACQFGAAFAARFFAAAVWSLGLSDVHARHRRYGYRCFDPFGGTATEAAAAELGCAFAVQAAAMHVHRLDRELRVHFIAAVITALVYAGGSISGAVFNPALAFSIQFPCSGRTYLEYCLVYWLGPVSGMASCVLLFEKIIPFLSGKRRQEVPAGKKPKTQ